MKRSKHPLSDAQLAARAGMPVLFLIASAMSGNAQINYTTGTSNWTQSWAENSGRFGPSAPYNFAQFSFGSDTTRGQVDGRRLTADGTLNGAALSLQVGQVLMINMGGQTGGGREGIQTGGRIGFTLGSGTDLFNGADALGRATNDARLRVDFLGGGSNTRVIGGTTLNGSNFNDFKSGRYYAIELLSKDQVLVRYGSTAGANDVVFNVLDLAGTAGSDIGKIMVYNLGSNMDSLFGQVVVSDAAFLNYFNDDTVNTRSISGLVTNNQSTVNQIQKSGAGTVHITRTDNTLTGATTIKAGTLRINGDGSLGIAPASPTSSMLVIENGTLDLNGSFSLHANRGVTVDHSASTVLVGGSHNATIAGVVAGSGGLTKNGTGTLVLSNANTFTGATAVNQGALILDGSTHASSAVTVASGATFGGSGAANGAVTVNGSIAPGNNSIGQLETGAVTWNGGASASSSTDWRFDLGASNSSDQLDITGNFTKGTGGFFRFDFLGSSNTGVFDLITWSVGTSFTAGDFSYTNLGGGLSGSFSITGNTLRFTAIPEPTGAVAGLLLGLGLLRRRR